MAIINFQCKKCKNEFDCKTGKITFGNILDFEREIICPKCGKLNKEDIWLTELGQTQIGELYLSEGEPIIASDYNLEKESVLDLCDEIGTGFNAIIKANENDFYPILFSIEETISLHYQKNLSLEDSQIIESLKKLRDNIFSENTEFNALENEIIKKIKRTLHLNSYNKSDVSLSISKVLNSVKLHKSMGGKRGYLSFISEFIN